MLVEAILEKTGRRVITVHPDAPVMVVARRMRLERLGAMIVSRNGDEVLGIVSERDIALGLFAHGGGLARLCVRDVMARPTGSCAPQDSLRHAMAEMIRRRVRYLPVIEQGRLCGILGIRDVVQSRLEELEREVARLRANRVLAR